MKKILSLLTLMLLAVAGLFAQSPAPGILNYQGVARNSVGNVLVNKNITLRLTIRDGSAAGPTVYSETRAVTTNPFGLFNVQLGSAGASAVTGTIAGVPWGVGLKYIQVEIDPNGGSSFINIGTAQLASVPYSLYSTIANDLVLPFNKTQADAGSLFRITNSGTGSGSTALEGITNSGAGNAYAVIGTVNNGSAGGFSAGVRGNNLSTTGLGIGVYGSQSGSGWGVYGVTPNGIGVNGSGGNGTGVWGSATTGTGGRFTSTSGLALHTSGGGVRLQNINEAANRILATIPGDGTATWQDPSAVGIVTGSGTLNFVPKWTPNGTNLGNSQIFDNGTLVGVGAGNAPFAAKLDVLSGQQQIVAHRYTGVTGFDLFYNNTNTYNGYIGTWNTGTSTRNFDVGTGDINNVGSLNLVTQALPRMSILPDGTVGVNTTAPVATSKMHINGAGATGAITTRTSLFTGGNLDGANGHGVIADGEWRAVWGRNTGTGGRIEATGVRGEAGGSNYTNGAGVLGTATGTGNNIGVSGMASGSAAINYGLRGQATGATAGQNWGMFAQTSTAGGQNVAVAGQAPIAANSWAGAFFGRVNITDGTQALNRVFTSDAVGNGSWQPLAAIGGVNGNGTLNYVPKWTPDGTTLGNSLFFDDGTAIGLGTTTPSHRLDVTHSGSTGIGVNSSAGFSVVDINGASGDAALRFQNAGVNQWNTRNRPADNYYEIFEMGGGGSRMVIQDGTGNVGIGQTVSPSYKLDVLHAGSTGLRVQSSASFSVVDIDAASGDAALRFVNNGVNQWNIRNRPADDYLEIFELGGGGSRMVIQDGTGNVGIGQTVSPSYKLDILHPGSTGLRVQSSASFSVVDIDAASGDAALRFANNGVNQWNMRNEPGSDNLQIFELGGGGERLSIKDGTGNIAIGGASGVYRLDVDHAGSTGARIRSNASFSVVDIDAASGDAALRFANNGVNQWNMRNEPGSDNLQIFELGGGGERLSIKDGTGNIAIGGSSGVYRLDVDHAGSTGARIRSNASFSVVDIDAASGDAALRFAKAGVNQWNTRNNPGTDDYQIFELGGGGERMRIENTTGAVVVSGDFTALGVKLFTMDHPMDPENKLLRHAAAESNEVINFYSGNATTDGTGKVTVQLPDYFEAINKDFRYQLTVIGSFAQAIISKEVANNQFEISTSIPNIKVSWEVKGVRNDARMQSKPFVAVQEKPATQKGKYWDPASHNQPESKGVSYDPSLSSSLNYQPAADVKIPIPQTGGSLDQQPVIAAVPDKSVPTGSVVDVKQEAPVKKQLPVSGSVEEAVPVKGADKKITVDGSVVDPVMKNPVPKVVDAPKVQRILTEAPAGIAPKMPIANSVENSNSESNSNGGTVEKPAVPAPKTKSEQAPDAPVQVTKTRQGL